MQIIEQIDRTTQMLSRTSRDKKATLADLALIQEQIRNREKVIENIRADLKLSHEQIQKADQQHGSLSEQYLVFKRDYINLLRISYRKMLTQNNLVYLLSSKDWEESLQRMRYAGLIEKHLKNKMESMDLTARQIRASIQTIEEEQQKNSQLLDEMQRGFAQLEQDEKRKDLILQQLQGDEKRLRGALIKQKTDREALNKAIEDMILARLSEKKADLKTPGMAGSFGQTKGKLPWPLKKATVVSRFGKQKHPTLENVFLNNNGIDLLSAGDVSVLAVFQGEIAGSMQIPGNDFMVMIRHGSFYSVYSHLREVVVNKGDTVEAGQVIGRIDPEDKTLHFEIWEQTRKLDPSVWLR